MNKLDERVYAALKFFTDNTRAEVAVISEKNKQDYELNVPEDVEKYLSEMKYIDAEGNSRYMITVEGLKESRVLERIKNQDKILTYAIIAVIISLISLAKSFRWL